MNHHTNPDFWDNYNSLPDEIKALANKAFILLQQNPAHPSLRFKKVGDYWSVRVSNNYRALAVDVSDGLVWFWIGKHAQYDKLLR